MDIPHPPARRRRAWLRALAAGPAAWITAPVLAASAAPLKAAWISPQTGPLAAFGSSDRFVHQRAAPRLRTGVPTRGGPTRPVDLQLLDAASSPARAQALAREQVEAGVQLVVATATPEICNPVADVCEAAGVPCVTAIAPWQAWFNDRGGDPTRAFEWTYHFFAGMEDFADVHGAMLARAGLGRRVGGVFGEDIDGPVFQRAFGQALARRQLELVVPQRVDLARPQWRALALALKDAGLAAVAGNLPPPLAVDFIRAADAVGYRPRMAAIEKALVFPATAQALGSAGGAMTTAVWWSPAWPFRSQMTGETGPELARAFEQATGQPWVQPLGFAHALADVVAALAAEAADTTRPAVRQAIRTLRLPTLVGTLRWGLAYPNRNVCTTPAVGGQWLRDAQGRWQLEIVDNSRSPFIPKTAELRVG